MKYSLLFSLTLFFYVTANAQSNIAIGKTVTSSAGGSNLSNLTDGNFSTVASTGNSLSQPNAEWFLIDLGADYFIDSLMIGCNPANHNRLRRFMMVTYPSSLPFLGNKPSDYVLTTSSSYNRLVYTDGSKVTGGTSTPFGATATSPTNPNIPGTAGATLGPDFPTSGSNADRYGFNVGMHKARYILLINLQDDNMEAAEVQVFTNKTSIRSIINGGFEQGSGHTGGTGVIEVREGLVNGWNTTEAVGMWVSNTTVPAQGGVIEFWGTGTTVSGTPVTSAAGNAFVELNAFISGQLDQRQICVMAGESMNFSFAHRGRNGVDVMRLRINDVDVAEMSDNNTNSGTGTHAATLLQPSTTTITLTPTVTNGWGLYSGTWTNTTGANVLVSFGFRAVSSASGLIGSGNFLDAVSFTGLNPTVSFNKATGSGPETVPTANLPKLYLIGLVSSPITLELNITGGTATRGTDYTTTPASGLITMTIPAGEYDGTDATAVSLASYIHINSDALSDDMETINMTIQSPGAGLKIADANICGVAISSTVYTIIDGTLPVKLTSFTAQKQNGNGLLNWHTATEINTASIVIEKSTAGVIGFIEIGRVVPTGDNSFYSFTDNRLMTGINYYRLKIIDLDGSIDYSDVRLINNSNGNMELQLFPNPVTSVTKLTLPAIGSSQAVVKLYNATGSLVQTLSAANKQMVDIDLSKMPKGLYMVKYYDGAELFNTKIMRQ